jgi:hypothetical protein
MADAFLPWTQGSHVGKGGPFTVTSGSHDLQPYGMFENASISPTGNPTAICFRTMGSTSHQFFPHSTTVFGFGLQRS